MRASVGSARLRQFLPRPPESVGASRGGKVEALGCRRRGVTRLRAGCVTPPVLRGVGAARAAGGVTGARRSPCAAVFRQRRRRADDHCSYVPPRVPVSHRRYWLRLVAGARGVIRRLGWGLRGQPTAASAAASQRGHPGSGSTRGISKAIPGLRRRRRNRAAYRGFRSSSARRTDDNGGPVSCAIISGQTRCAVHQSRPDGERRAVTMQGLVDRVERRISGTPEGPWPQLAGQSNNAKSTTTVLIAQLARLIGMHIHPLRMRSMLISSRGTSLALDRNDTTAVAGKPVVRIVVDAQHGSVFEPHARTPDLDEEIDRILVQQISRCWPSGAISISPRS